jgi:hypothetical protein
MVSDKQLEANRANAQKSTGPRTEEGKRRSSLNATRHGLTGQVIVVPEENLAAFNQFTAAQVANLDPGDDNERQLAQSWAVIQHRINHAQAIEYNLYTKGVMDDLAGNLNIEHPEAHNAMCDVQTFIRESKAIGNMSLYIGRLVRQASTILKDFNTMKAARLRNETAELIKAERVLDAFQKKGLVFDPRENGFVFPLSRLEAYIHRKNLDWPPYIDELVKSGRLKAA